VDSAARVAKVVEAEEKQFDRVLKIGVTRLNEELKGTFTGEKAFHLYETFGLPLDFMVDAARMPAWHSTMRALSKPRKLSRLAPALHGRWQPEVGQPGVSRAAEDFVPWV